MKAKPLIYQFDDVHVEVSAFQVFKGGRVAPLEPKAIEVLVFLIEHRGRLVEKGEILDAVWKDAFVTPSAMTRVIAQLRKTLGDDAKEARYIETVPTRGYRFIAEVEVTSNADGQLQRDEVGIEGSPAGEVESVLREATTAFAVPQPSAAEAKQVRRSFQWLRSPKFLTLSGAAGLLFIILAIVWNSRTKPQAGETASAFRTTQITTSLGLDIYPSLSPDGNAIAYSSDRSGNFEIYVKPLVPGARELQLTSDGEQNFQPAWSPDGKLIAYYSKNRGGIWIIPASGGVSKQITESGSYPAWAPDGSVIAFQSYPLTDLSATSVGAMPPSTLWMVPSQGGAPIPITQVGTPPGGHGAPSWSPDGKRIVFVANDGTAAEIYTISAGGADLKRVSKRREWFYDPIYSSDGESLYYGGVSEHGNFVLYKHQVSPTNGDAVGEPLEVANTVLARIKHLTISADGKKLAYSAPTMKSSISSVPISPDSNGATVAPASLTQNTSYRKALPRISPDGQKIAYVEFRGGVNQDIWVMDSDGGNPVQLTTDPAIDWAPSWFPDNDRVAFQSHRQGKYMLWSVSIKSGREKLLMDPGQDIGWPALSPDGKQIAFNSRKSGTINIWTAAVEGGQPAQLTFDKEMMGWPCWSPDGKLLSFQMGRGDETYVMVMPSSGGTPTQLTFDRGQSWPHDWSPDGDKIVFAGSRNGYWNLYWVSRTAKNQKQVTNYKKLNAYVRYPAWSPLGNQIVYEYAETTGNIWLMELK